MRRNGHKEKILVYKFVRLTLAEPWKFSVSARYLEAPCRGTPYIVGWNRSGVRRKLIKSNNKFIHRGIHAYRQRDLAKQRARSNDETVLVGHVLVKDIFGVANNGEIVARKIYFSRANYKKAFLTALKKCNWVRNNKVRPSAKMINELGIKDKEIK